MKGDFTRTTFNPKKHFSSVRMQQGRVQLDADWNEQVDIAAHRVETEAIDTLGACGAPMHAAAFGILANTASLSAGDIARLTQAGLLPLAVGDFLLTPGRFYVDGLLCENEDYATYISQPDLPGIAALSSSGDYLIYLDAWPRHLTALEDEQIREVALGGPDTATRTRTIWQVRSLPVAADTNCLSDLSAWDTLVAGSTGQLNARAEPEATSTDPCIVPPSAGFRGLQNQLYRVEIHQAGDLGGATFKWSRDNGSVLCAIEEFIDGQPTDRVRLRSLGRGAAGNGGTEDLGLRIGDWIEILDNDHELTNTPGDLVQITDIDQDDLIVTLSASVSGYDLDSAVKVRRWDSDGELAVEVPLTNDGWIPLEEGVEVQFSAGSYQTGDYWLIPARTILGNPVLTHTGGIEWPYDPTTQDPLPQPPAGIRHHYCRLAVVHFDGTVLTISQDCRPIFPPASELVHLYYVGGDGQEAMPGDVLPQPLQAGVSNGAWPVVGAKVRFSITSGGGTLTTADGADGAEVIVITDANGVAACTWDLDIAPVSQQVEAFLLDAAEDNVGLPVRYSANLSIASQVAYDGNCENFSEVETVQEALDALCQNAALYYVGGDGQEALPGETLPQPLQAGVSVGAWSVVGARVRFTVTGGGGTLTAGASSGSQVIAVSDANGVAACTWDLATAPVSQQVEAFLLDAAEANVGLPLRYSANLSIASQVAYDSKCEDLSEVETVQEALDELCRNAALYYVGGDGQEALPGEKLPFPLEVRLANGQWPVPDAKIVFRILPPGFGVLTAADGTAGAEVTVITDRDGLAACSWQLDSQNASQQVVAFWTEAENLFIHFNANLELGGGQPEAAAIHIKEIRLGKEELLLHDSIISVPALSEGILITCDGSVDPEAFAGKPICFVTIEMPFPLNSADREFWGSELLGFQPLKLRANVDLQDNNTVISWSMVQEVQDFLFRLLSTMREFKLGDLLLAHLTVKGNFVWSEQDFDQYLDGEAFGVSEKIRPQFPNNLRLPSGDRIRGGDFEMWFRLIEG